MRQASLRNIPNFIFGLGKVASFSRLLLKPETSMFRETLGKRYPAPLGYVLCEFAALRHGIRWFAPARHNLSFPYILSHADGECK
jgi:hypothetical protein